MPALQSATFSIPLKTAKTSGLGDLGIPSPETAAVKKGKLGEAMQMLDGERIGRRYQNLRATLVKTTEGGVEVGRLVVAFEVFGDDNTPATVPSAVSARLMANGESVGDLQLGAPYLPFASCWYDNHFAAPVDPATCERIDAIELVAAGDEVRLTA